MRPDGDPDDYGLPPVDVVVPDDARDLEADLLAYRREQRRARRRRRRTRLRTPITRLGVAAPIIAAALLLAVLTGTLLTVFGPRAAPRPAGSPVATSAGRPGEVGGVLPDGAVVLNGRLVPAIDVRPGVIGIVRPGCECAAMITEIARQARNAEIKFWLTTDRRGTRLSAAEALKHSRGLAGDVPEGMPQVVEDRAGTLADTYAPPSDTPGRFTAVLVHADGVVAEVMQAPEPTGLPDEMRALRQPSTTGS